MDKWIRGNKITFLLLLILSAVLLYIFVFKPIGVRKYCADIYNQYLGLGNDLPYAEAIYKHCLRREGVEF